jgi:hypothetical protein
MAVSTVFFYEKTIEETVIIDALQYVLADFPLFAGVLRKEKGQLWIDCNNQGVSLTVVHSKWELKNSELIDEVNPNRMGKPVLRIKLTYFADGRFAMGCSWHHCVGDMAAFMEFMKALSARARKEIYPLPIIPENREEYFRSPTAIAIEEHGLKYLNVRDIIRFIRQKCYFTKTLYLHFTDKEIHSMREELCKQMGRKLSRNDVLCAHILEVLALCRTDGAETHYASIAVNCRKTLNIASNAMGNSLGAIALQFCRSVKAGSLAERIRDGIANYLYDPTVAKQFVDANGGMANVGRIVPKEFLPQYNNLIFSSWVNFGVYSIDFGVAPPYAFLPVGHIPLPWASRIVEGPNNQGRLVLLKLPSKVAKRLLQPHMLQELHKYTVKDKTS